MASDFGEALLEEPLLLSTTFDLYEHRFTEGSVYNTMVYSTQILPGRNFQCGCFKFGTHFSQSAVYAIKCWSTASVYNKTKICPFFRDSFTVETSRDIESLWLKLAYSLLSHPFWQTEILVCRNCLILCALHPPPPTPTHPASNRMI